MTSDEELMTADEHIAAAVKAERERCAKVVELAESVCRACDNTPVLLEQIEHEIRNPDTPFKLKPAFPNLEPEQE